MAAGSFVANPNGVLSVWKQEIDFLNDTIKATLLTSSYTYSAAHQYLSDVSANEASGVTRQTLANKTITLDGSNRTVLDADDVDFGNNVSLSAKYMQIFQDTGNPATSRLLGYVDLDSGGSTNLSSVNSDFDIAFNALGIYRVTP